MSFSFHPLVITPSSITVRLVLIWFFVFIVLYHVFRGAINLIPIPIPTFGRNHFPILVSSFYPLLSIKDGKRVIFYMFFCFTHNTRARGVSYSNTLFHIHLHPSTFTEIISPSFQVASYFFCPFSYH